MLKRATGVLVCCVGILSVSLCFGQEEETPDYSGGLKRLANMALPDLSEADFVTTQVFHFRKDQEEVPLVWLERVIRMGSMGMGGLSGIGAFVLEEGENGAMRVFHPTHVVEVDIPPVELKYGMTEEALATQMQHFRGKHALQQAISRIKQQLEQFLNQDHRMSGGTSAQLAPSALLFAAALHSNGKTEEANELAHLAFQLTSDRKALLTGAVSQVATGKYLEILLQFRQDQDWDAFRKDLATLIEERGEAWAASKTASKLLEKLREHGGESAALPEETFSAEQRDIAAEFLAASLPQNPAHSLAGWLLLPPQQLHSHPKDSAIIRFLALREDAVRILLQWLDDPALTPQIAVDRNAVQNAMRNMMPMGGNGDPQQMMAAYQAKMREAAASALPQPQSRSHVARTVLSALMPRDAVSNNGDNVSADFFRDEMERLLKFTPKELARHWLGEADPNSGTAAAGLRFLAVNGEEEDFQRIEQAVMNAQKYQQMNLLTQYLRFRGKDGADFLKRFEGSLPEAEGGMRQHWKRQLETARRYAGIKEDSEGPRDFKSLVKDSMEKPMQQRWEHHNDIRTAVTAMDTMDQRIDAMNFLLEMAVQGKRDDSEKQMLFSFMHILPTAGQHAQRMQHSTNQSSELVTWETLLAGKGPNQGGNRHSASFAMPQNDDIWDTEKAIKAIRDNADTWRALFEEQDTPSASSMMPWGGSSMSAMVILTLTQEQSTWQKAMMGAQGRLMARLPRNGAEWMEDFARRFLAGEIDELPPYPNPESVSDKRRSEILDSIKTTEDDGVPSLLETLPPAEYLALLEELETEEHESVRKRMITLSRVVRQTTSGKPEFSAAIKKYQGRSLKRKMLEEMLEATRKQAKQGTAITIALHSSLLGTRAVIGTQPSPFGGHGMHEQPLVSGMMRMGQSTGAHAMWAVPTNEKADDTEAPKDLDARLKSMPTHHFSSQQDRFWDQVDKALEADNDPPLDPVTVTFSGQVPEKDTRNEEK